MFRLWQFVVSTHFFPVLFALPKIQNNARDCDSSTILEADKTFSFKNMFRSLLLLMFKNIFKFL